MSTVELFTQYSLLPPHLQKEVANFMAFLQSKEPKTPKKKERKFGCLKGAMTMAPDFDEPLEDFKEYM
jgi:Protein of unknown function (DUF2281)